jgi:hypothetical protein
MRPVEVEVEHIGQCVIVSVIGTNTLLFSEAMDVYLVATEVEMAETGTKDEGVPKVKTSVNVLLETLDRPIVLSLVTSVFN